MTKTQTKTVITKETIKQELLKETSKDIAHYIIVCAILTAAVAIVAVAVYAFFLYGNDIGILGHALFFACVAIFLYPSYIFASLSRYIASSKKDIENGEFWVDTDEVIYKEERDVMKHGHIYPEKIVHFYKYGDLHLPSTLYQLTSKGDVFYMVLTKNNALLQDHIYPAKIYEYKE